MAYVISQNYEKSLFIRFFPLAKKIDNVVILDNVIMFHNVVILIKK